MPATLVDSNVLVYTYDVTEERKRQRAGAVLDALQRSASGVLSTQVVGEFFVGVTRKLSVPVPVHDAVAAVDAYVRTWRVLDTTAEIVVHAVRGAQAHQLHYYDALIWAAARLHNITEILTEDGQHGRIIEGVRYQDPFREDFDLAAVLA